MIYQGIESQRHGDEIMVLQENSIIFKGFLRPQGLYLIKHEIGFKIFLFFVSY